MTVSLSNEFQITVTQATGDSNPTDVTRLASGRVVVTWIAGSDCKARIFSPTGAPLGHEFILDANGPSGEAPNNPRIVALADGGFLASWDTYLTSTGSSEVLARRYDSNGSALGPVFTVNQVITDTQSNPAIGALAAGGFVAAWTTNTYYGVKAQIFDKMGKPATGEFVVDQSDTAHDAAIAVLKNGNFVVVYSGANDGDDAIYVRIYSANGNALGNAIEITDHSSVTERYEPDVIATADGGFAVAWASGGFDAPNQILFRKFGAGGTSASATKVIGGIDRIGENRSVLVELKDGRLFAILHKNSESLNVDLYGQFLTSSGDPLGAAFKLNSAQSGDSQRSSAQELADGRIFVSWSLGDLTVKSRIIDPTKFSGSAQSDLWQGGNANDSIFGWAGNDRLDGKGGHDKLYGGSGRDSLYGDAGNDVLQGNADADAINGGTGTDTVSYYHDGTVKMALDGSYAANAQSGAAQGDTYVSVENIIGSNSGNDVLIGDAGANTIRGYGGSDQLWGRSGNDIIVGGTGADRMGGAAGADQFAWYSSAETGDTVIDFQTSDRLVFEGSSFGLGTYAGALSAANFRSVASGHAANTSSQRFIFDQSTDELWYDPDGVGSKAATMIVDLNDFNLTNGYLIVV